MGSRVLGAASACLVASGLFLCALGGALALADPSSSGKHGAGQSDEGPGKPPKDDPDGTGTGSGAATKTDDKPGTEAGNSTAESDKPGAGGNPNNGNCGQGNDGSNGSAKGCGGGSETPPSPSPSTTASVTTHTSTSTQTTTSVSTTTHTTTSNSATSTSTKAAMMSSKTTSATSTTTSSVGLPAPVGGGGGGGGVVEVPSGRPDVPEMQLPPASEPSVIDVVPRLGAAAADLPIPPITLPIIVAPAAGLGAGGPGGAPAFPALPAAPRGVTAEPLVGREPLPANVGSNIAERAASYRIGYTDYLRNAGLSQVAALAVPGIAGMLVLTGAGGLVGYRQAKAGHAVHTSGTARFLN